MYPRIALSDAARFDFPDDGWLATEGIVADAHRGDERLARNSRGGELVLRLVTNSHIAGHRLLFANPDKLPGMRHVRIP